MDKKLCNILQSRKQEVLELDKAGFQFEEYEPHLPEAETDVRLAFYYLVRDIKLDVKCLVHAILHCYRSWLTKIRKRLRQQLSLLITKLPFF